MLDTEFYKQWEQSFEWHKNALRPASEFDWFGIDSIGQIACFTTAGFGLVPEIVFRDKEMCWKIYNYFYEEPKDYTIFSKTYTRMDYDVSVYGSRRLYSFDNPSDIRKPYEIINAPKTPVHISTLSLEIRESVAKVIFEKLDFAEIQKIDVSKYFECV